MNNILNTKTDQDKHHRRSIRLKDFDYSNPGGYFVTICASNRKYLFGKIANSKMQLNKTGKMIKLVWNELPQNYPGVNTDIFVVMPNHIHGIIVLTPVGAGPCACPGGGQPQGVVPTIPSTRASYDNGQPRGVAPTMLLPDVVHRFKSLTATYYRHSLKQQGLRSFPNKLWQRNYYEHVIRNEEKLNLIREYVLNNPLQWLYDRENPEHIQDKSYEDQWGDFEEILYGKICIISKSDIPV
jgi:REP element-mobilizing transposase RayT